MGAFLGVRFQASDGKQNPFDNGSEVCRLKPPTCDVVAVGIEPTRSRLPRGSHEVGPEGVEPSSFGVKVRCVTVSTTTLNVVQGRAFQSI